MVGKCNMVHQHSSRKNKEYFVREEEDIRTPQGFVCVLALRKRRLFIMTASGAGKGKVGCEPLHKREKIQLMHIITNVSATHIFSVQRPLCVVIAREGGFWNRGIWKICLHSWILPTEGSLMQME